MPTKNHVIFISKSGLHRHNINWNSTRLECLILSKGWLLALRQPQCCQSNFKIAFKFMYCKCKFLRLFLSKRVSKLLISAFIFTLGVFVNKACYQTRLVLTAPLFCSNRNKIILEFGHRGKVAIALLAYCSEAFTLLAYCIMTM